MKQKFTYKEIGVGGSLLSPGKVIILILYMSSSIGVRGSLCVYSQFQKLLQLELFLLTHLFLQRIAGITAMLQQSLEGLLLEGLQTSDVDIVRHCLRTYATIDKTRDAEALVGQVLVKPYIDEVCAPPSTNIHELLLCL